MIITTITSFAIIEPEDHGTDLPTRKDTAEVENAEKKEN